MRLIDADKLYPDSVSIKGDRLCISQSQIANAPTVDVLDKIRAEIEQGYCKVENDYDRGRNMGLHITMQIIDKYKEESEKE